MDGLLTNQPRVAVVGAGMSGLCMGAKLREAGIHDFTVYEKADEVGGTWRENTYPGLTCDVPSRFYSYSFAPNPGWTRHFAPGREIQRYFTGAVDLLGLRPHIRFGAEVGGARWEDGRWRLRTRDGQEDVVDVLISATGVLHHPREPDIDGLDSFAGACFHSARWDHSVPLEGRRVAVIGTGSTGVQIVCALSRVAGRLLVFQRTAQWILPTPNLPYSGLSRRLFERFPALNRLSYRYYQAQLEFILGQASTRPGWQRRLIDRLCRLNLRFGVRDPELRRRLTPGYEPMCKRLVMSAGFYPAMQRPNVGLVTEPIERVEPRGIVTRDGRLHEIDVLVLATGFDAHAYMRPMGLVGQSGRTLEEAWEDGPRAYRTVALPGFPNFFMLMGPHSPIGNQSLVAVAETQADYVLRWIEEIRRGRVASAAPTPDATARFNDDMRRAMPGTIWTTGCNSWYLGADGVPELWPWTPARHRAMLREPDRADFVLSTNSPA
jgi:cation diffusion facilitator CzcD-associated flavoprotein CzcO